MKIDLRRKGWEEKLSQDALANGRKTIKPTFYGDDIWKFIVWMRKFEYYNSCQGNKFLILPFKKFAMYKYYSFSKKLGIEIPINVFEGGLSIAHAGTIVVSNNARIGKNCRIHEGVTIGATGGENDAATIGNNVFIGTGAKVIGQIRIANDVCIGANSVVVKDILEAGTTWGGVPARKISNKNSHSNLSKLLELD